MFVVLGAMLFFWFVYVCIVRIAVFVCAYLCMLCLFVSYRDVLLSCVVFSCCEVRKQVASLIDSSLDIRLAVHYSLFAESVLLNGTPEQLAKWKDPILSYKLPGCFAMTEVSTHMHIRSRTSRMLMLMLMLVLMPLLHPRCFHAAAASALA